MFIGCKKETIVFNITFHCDTIINMLLWLFDRLVIDQSARRNAQIHFKIQDHDFYEFEGFLS